jgi:hypothetical protein
MGQQLQTAPGVRVELAAAKIDFLPGRKRRRIDLLRELIGLGAIADTNAAEVMVQPLLQMALDRFG